MNFKIFAQLLIVSCWVFCLTQAYSVPKEGCFECEEEVWEEVPCEDVPKNITTSTSTTTTTSTSTSTTTSTTPRPISSTTEDPYKKCYCECKVGCKEFCRKVSVHPEPKKQILQVSKITEPISQGRLESTHYHQRELVTKKAYKPVHRDSYNTVATVPGNANTYAKAHAGFNKPSYTHPYEAIKPQSHYYAPPQVPSGTYEFPIPFANTYAKHSKSAQGPLANNLKVSVSTSNSIPNHHYPASEQVKHSEVDNHVAIQGATGYDSVESYLKDIMHGSPSSKYQSYNGYGGHQYSMSFR